MKNIVAPIPTYLLCSMGYFFKVFICAPEQNQKKRVTFFINKGVYTSMKRFEVSIVTDEGKFDFLLRKSHKYFWSLYFEEILLVL